jgi:hypothetical protein
LNSSINALHESFENVIDFQDNWVIVPKDSPVNWEVNELVGYNSSNSISVQNFNYGTVSSFEFISQPFDASDLPAIALSFDYSYAQKQSSNIEQMQVSVSIDCGQTWLIRKTYYGSTSLRTVDTLVTSNFFPLDSTQWKNDVITNITSAYLTDNLQFKFRFDAKAGNNIYLDNIRIADPAILGIKTSEELDFLVYPNPTSNFIDVKVPVGLEISSWNVYNMPGQLVLQSKMKQTDSFQISFNNLEKGIYILEMITDSGFKKIRILKE